jgi:hypothetical protein
VTGVNAWLAALPDVESRLRGEPPARLAWIGCDDARLLVRLAHEYPRVSVYASSEDPGVVEAATPLARAGRVGDRVLVVGSGWLAQGLAGWIDVAILTGPLDALTWARRAPDVLALLRAHGIAVVRTAGFRPAVAPAPRPAYVGSPLPPHLRPAEPLAGTHVDGLWVLRRAG